MPFKLDPIYKLGSGISQIFYRDAGKGPPVAPPLQYTRKRQLAIDIKNNISSKPRTCHALLTPSPMDDEGHFSVIVGIDSNGYFNFTQKFYTDAEGTLI